MLSKSKGLILRVAGVLHMLFHLDSPDRDFDRTVSDEALKAAEDFVDVCCQHVAYLAGRGEVDEAIFQLQKCKINKCCNAKYDICYCS